MQFPENAVFCEVISEQGFWTVEWHHVIQGIPVKDDYLRLHVNPYSGKVACCAIQWTDMPVQGKIKLCKWDAMRVLRNLHLTGTDSKKELTAELTWIKRINGKKCVPAWDISNELGEFSVNARTGSILEMDYYFIAYEAQSAHTVFDDPEHEGPGWPTSIYVHNIMKKHFDRTRHVVDPTSKSAWLSASSSYVFFSVGHGDKTSSYNFIRVTASVKVYPWNITNAPSRWLVYLLHCWSGWLSYPLENCIGMQFVWNSRYSNGVMDNAFVGFSGLVHQIRGCEFTKKFWYKLDYGYSVHSAKLYASSYYPDIGSICEIYGDTTITLTGGGGNPWD